MDTITTQLQKIKQANPDHEFRITDGTAWGGQVTIDRLNICPNCGEKMWRNIVGEDKNHRLCPDCAQHRARKEFLDSIPR
jgi:ribosomal protein L32